MLRAGTIVGQLGTEEVEQIAMIGEDMRFGAERSRMGGIEPSICAGHSMLCPYRNLSMHAGDEAVGRAAGLRRDTFGGVDFHVMDWAFRIG